MLERIELEDENTIQMHFTGGRVARLSADTPEGLYDLYLDVTDIDGEYRRLTLVQESINTCVMNIHSDTMVIDIKELKNAS